MLIVVKYQINNEKYISDNKKLAASNTDKAKLHEVLMKDFCILHQDELGVKDLINVHKDKISDDLYKIVDLDIQLTYSSYKERFIMKIKYVINTRTLKCQIIGHR